MDDVRFHGDGADLRTRFRWLPRAAAATIAAALVPGMAFWFVLNLWAVPIAGFGICSDVGGCSEGDRTSGILVGTAAILGVAGITTTIGFGFWYAVTGEGGGRLMLSLTALVLTVGLWYGALSI